MRSEKKIFQRNDDAGKLHQPAREEIAALRRPDIPRPQTGPLRENRVLNEREIEQKKTRLGSRVRSLHVNLTMRCNQQCPYCLQAGFTKKEMLSDRSCDGILQMLPYLQRIIWQGGEAFLHPRFREMIEASLKHPCLEQTLLTNGQFLSVPWVELFSRAATFNYDLPVHSLRKAVYEDLCRGAKFDALMRAVDLINEYRKKSANRTSLSMNMIMMRRNYTELENVAQFAAEKGFSNIILTPLYDNGTSFYEREYLSPENPEVRDYFSEVLPRIEGMLQKKGISLYNRFIKRGPDRPDAPPRPGPGGLLCLAPWQQLYIEANEEVRAHCYCPFSVGDLGRESLQEIWNGEPIVRLRERLLGCRYDLCNPLCTQGILGRENLRLV